MRNGSVLSGLENKYGKQMVAEELLRTLLELRKSGKLTDEEVENLLGEYKLSQYLGLGSGEEDPDAPEDERGRIKGVGTSAWKMRKALAALEKEQEKEQGEEEQASKKAIVTPPPTKRLRLPPGEEEEENLPVPGADTEPLPVPGADTLRPVDRAPVVRKPKEEEETGLRVQSRIPPERQLAPGAAEEPVGAEVGEEEKPIPLSVRIGQTNLNRSSVDMLKNEYVKALQDPSLQPTMVRDFVGDFRSLIRQVASEAEVSRSDEQVENAAFLNNILNIVSALLVGGRGEARLKDVSKLEEEIRKIVGQLLNEAEYAMTYPDYRRVASKIKKAAGKSRLPVPEKEKEVSDTAEIGRLNLSDSDIKAIRLQNQDLFNKFLVRNAARIGPTMDSLDALLSSIASDPKSKRGSREHAGAGLIRDVKSILMLLFDIEGESMPGVQSVPEKEGVPAGMTVAESKQLQDLKSKIYKRLMNEFQNNK